MKKIIAVDNEGRYLLSIDDNNGQILSTEEGVLYPPFYLASLYARGYWEPYEGDQSVLQDLLKSVVSLKGGNA